jgi:hypothetical protein
MTYTVEDHSRDYALYQGAPAAIADAYAAYVMAEIDADPSELDGWNHMRRWPCWAERNLSECFQCGSGHALRFPDALPPCWECQDCGCTRAAREGMIP